MLNQDNKPDQQINWSQYGEQGNEGQYGQGQYTSEGKPDPHGPEAQEIQQGQYGKPEHQIPAGQSQQNTGAIENFEQQNQQSQAGQ
jgi:hypothetical protein